MNLDAILTKCAELIGWEKITHSTYLDGLVGTEPGLGYANRTLLPRFTTSADAAWQLVAFMEKPESGKWSWFANQNTAGPGVSFTFIPNREGNVGARADTLPLAICLAFLKAHDINSEELGSTE